MSEVPRNLSAGLDPEEAGPDYLGFFKHALLELLSYNGDVFPYHEPSVLTSSEERLFSRGIKGLSDFQIEKLTAMLNESKFALDHEVDEVCHRVFQFQKHLPEKEAIPCYLDATNEGMNERLYKKQKSTSSSLGTPLDGQARTSGTPLLKKVDNEFQNLSFNNELGTDGARKIDAKLRKMGQQLEEYMNILMSMFRPMTLAEKQQLLNMIKKIPRNALDRVINIIQSRKPSESNPPDEIHVDLEEEDDVTLWRLYFHVKLVATANNISL
ncbi:hypothetical protein QJS10_CPB18g00608 [Acorus calamus]|uniref:NET domain-containing protein n=1 Tax=Acorus calamus TaxID=4465 RepID=A0AAV9CM41_ACOCL|nr:hypothetical protein QJS10_CPB18g00608 [Acorus calamus]